MGRRRNKKRFASKSAASWKPALPNIAGGQHDDVELFKQSFISLLIDFAGVQSAEVVDTTVANKCTIEQHADVLVKTTSLFSETSVRNIYNSYGDVQKPFIVEIYRIGRVAHRVDGVNSYLEYMKDMRSDFVMINAKNQGKWSISRRHISQRRHCNHTLYENGLVHCT